MHPLGSSGVVEGGAYRKVSQEPGRPHFAPMDWQRCKGNHNLVSGIAGESEKPILVVKSRNWGGAKGLCCKRDFANKKGEPLVETPDHYGRLGSR